jgi:hypothetical protein
MTARSQKLYAILLFAVGLAATPCMGTDLEGRHHLYQLLLLPDAVQRWVAPLQYNWILDDPDADDVLSPLDANPFDCQIRLLERFSQPAVLPDATATPNHAMQLISRRRHAALQT